MRSTLVLLVGAIGLASQFVSGQQQRTPDPRSRGGADCRDNAYNCVETPNPISSPDTVWLEEMTWMDVRDALNTGTKTVICADRRHGTKRAVARHR